MKNIVDCCFVCGKTLYSLEEKICHRLNPKKRFKPNNVIIVCEDCKRKIQKNKDFKFDFNPLILWRYFKKYRLEQIRILIKKIKDTYGFNKEVSISEVEE